MQEHMWPVLGWKDFFLVFTLERQKGQLMDLIHCCSKFVLKGIGGKKHLQICSVSTNSNHNECKLFSCSYMCFSCSYIICIESPVAYIGPGQREVSFRAPTAELAALSVCLRLGCKNLLNVILLVRCSRVR